MRRIPLLRRSLSVLASRSFSATGRRQARRSLTSRAAAVPAAGLLVVSLLGVAPPASAQAPDGSKELAARVDHIVARRASLGDRISVLDEQANLAAEQLADVNNRAKVNESDVSSAEQEMQEARGQVRRYAVRAFTGGVGSGSASAHDNPTEAIRSRTLLATAQGNREQAVEQVRAARSDLTSKQQLLDETAKAKSDAQRRIKSARTETKQAEQELAATEAQVKGDLATALQREETQRIAAERAEAKRRQAEAEAAAQAQAKAAAEAEVAAQTVAEAETVGLTESGSPSADSAGSNPSETPSRSTTTRPPAGSKRASGGTSSSEASAPATKIAAERPKTPATPVPTTNRPRPTVPAPTAPPRPVAPPPPPPPPPPPSSTGQRAVQAALSMRGTPYRWGGESPGGFDCSGLVLWAYAQAGRGGLPHSSSMQASMGRRISVGELMPGDLVAYGSPVHHIGIYIGGGQYVHAPRTGDVVKVASIYRFNGTPIAVRI